jgi:NADH pyrophosphatase NudC (nudix superfamily)
MGRGMLKLLQESGASTYAECVELLQKHRLIPVEFCEKCGEPLYAGDFGKTSGCVPCGILWMS